MQMHPPPIVSPYSLGSWRQPDREQILIDDRHAVMSQRTFEQLLEYSATIPTGVYPGKYWRRHDSGRWLFCWYGPLPDPSQCSINARELLLA